MKLQSPKINESSSKDNLAKESQSVQFKDNRPEAATQLKVQQMANEFTGSRLVQNKVSLEPSKKENKTGLPDNLKSGIENLSGMDLSDVKVHYNSPQPAQLQAHAYTQGNQIHVASGQEKHLPHEAWHVVQQKQGRVQPTTQLKGNVNINDDTSLENEADVMGMKALQMKTNSSDYHGTQLKPARISKTGTMQRVIDIDINGISATASTEELDKNVTPIEYFQETTSQKLKSPQPGYIGTAIVYSGEKDAVGLVKKYVENSQDWSSKERKARLGVKFGYNKKASVDPIVNPGIINDVKTKTTGAYNNVAGKVSSYIFGVTWGVSYKFKGRQGAYTTTQIREALNGTRILDDDIKWKNGQVDAEKSEVIGKCDQLSKAKGIPYGMLRSWVTFNGKAVNQQLQANGATPVYNHSIDADAPDFVTLKKKTKSSGFKKVLDAYDEIIGETGNPKMVIGGYNLLAQPEKYSGKDYQHTVRSNVVDLAIRQAIHSVAPIMTYPTEPNFLIRTDIYDHAERNEAPKSYAWGDTAFEGRNLYDSLIRDGLDPKDVVYDPLASVATGVEAGGERLKIKTGKKYDEGTISVKPQGSTKNVTDEIPLEEQYIVQAQSLAGATRLATAYLAAFRAKNPKPGYVPAYPKKDTLFPYFAPIEEMVLALLKDQEIVPRLPDIGFDDSSIPIHSIIKSVAARLLKLQQHPAFKKIIE